MIFFQNYYNYNFTFFGKEVIMLKDPRLKVLLIGCKTRFMHKRMLTNVLRTALAVTN